VLPGAEVFVIVFAAVLASAATFLALLPFDMSRHNHAVVIGGSIAGLLSGIVIARLAATSRESTDLRWPEGQPARES